MSTILVTGVSGFIGTALAASLAERHTVIGMSRRKPAVDTRWVKGDFAAYEDLRQLDGDTIDAVVHLAAVTGGCLERDGVLVNVEGTRCLMRYLIDRGCRKYVMASSIAVVGMQSVAFRPVQLPISDEHPCLDRDGYGFSKYLMEEVTKYYQRQRPDLDVTNLRLASIAPDEKMPPLRGVCPPRMWGLGSLTVMARSDAVRALTMAVEAAHRPGVRILNATCPKAWTADPVAEILRRWWGSDVDLSHYREKGRGKDSVYDVGKIERELGFVARVLPEGT